MSCSRGKAHPNASTKLRLFADSAGYCQNPKCNNPLFPDSYSGNPHIAEMAHIFAAMDGGPRTDDELSAEERGGYDNIVLLCANCHTLVDKTPDDHPAELMSKWKAAHLEKLQRSFGLVSFRTREELRSQLVPLLDENRAIHQHVGPDLEYRFNPEAHEADVWKARVRSTIIPNSNKILLLLDGNRALLTKDEINTLEQFRFHVKGLILRHFEGESLANSQFPPEMNGMGA